MILKFLLLLGLLFCYFENYSTAVAKSRKKRDSEAILYGNQQGSPHLSVKKSGYRALKRAKRTLVQNSMENSMATGGAGNHMYLKRKKRFIGDEDDISSYSPEQLEEMRDVLERMYDSFYSVNGDEAPRYEIQGPAEEDEEEVVQEVPEEGVINNPIDAERENGPFQIPVENERPKRLDYGGYGDEYEDSGDDDEEDDDGQLERILYGDRDLYEDSRRKRASAVVPEEDESDDTENVYEPALSQYVEEVPVDEEEDEEEDQGGNENDNQKYPLVDVNGEVGVFIPLGDVEQEIMKEEAERRKRLAWMAARRKRADVNKDEIDDTKYASKLQKLAHLLAAKKRK